MEDLTSKIKEILDTPDGQVNIAEAATVLLKINRNKILHQNIIRRNNVAKLKYELKKIYDFRMKESAIAETAELEKQVAKVVKKTFPEAEKIEASEKKGKRADHDRLPDEIKAMFLENLNIYPRMRKLHEQLKLLGNAMPCDRYPFLKELKALDEKLRANWDAYDAFVLPPAENENSGTGTGETPTAGITPTEPSAENEKMDNTVANNDPELTVDAKEISAARKYLSDNKTKLKEMKDSGDRTKYPALLVKMQERLDLLIHVNAGVSEDYIKELKELGLNA
jgi:hypothetical protein